MTTFVLNLFIGKSIRYGSQYTTHLSTPRKILSEYYKRTGKNCISTHQYYVYGAPYCFSGFFSWSETVTSNVLVQGPVSSMAFVGGKRYCSGVEKRKSKITNWRPKFFCQSSAGSQTKKLISNPDTQLTTVPIYDLSWV